jgi:molybdenum cofactor biosynthesis protein B
MSVEEHKASAPERVSCFVVSVSDTRTEEDDFSGALVKELLETNFHHVVGTQIIKDDPGQIRHIAGQATGHDKIQVIFFTGGTGISTRDNTAEVLEGLFDKRIPGFGELFRDLSYQDIGPSAMLSGATAGVMNGKVIFALPGSDSGVNLAMRELILPELGHLIYELTKQGDAPPPDEGENG